LNILHITPDFNYACGRSYYVFLLLKYLRHNYNVYIITNGGDSLDRLEELKIPFKLIQSLKSKNPVAIVKNINEIRAFIKENDINIIHTHHRYSELIGLQAKNLIRSNKPKAVFTALSIVDKRYKVEYKSDKIIAVSNSVKKMLTEKFRVDKNKISVIPNFTDTEEIHEHEVSSHGDNRFFNILAVGRFHHEKNFEVLLKTLNLLNDSAIKLTLVGEGNNDIDYRKYIAEYKLNVELIAPQKNLKKYFDKADICVLPSSRDPFPNFMLQAGLHQKPFIGTKIDGIAELINDGKNGLLFSNGNEQELAEKILSYKNDKNLASKCAVNLHNDVMANYTQKSIIPKIEQIYNDVIRK